MNIYRKLGKMLSGCLLIPEMSCKQQKKVIDEWWQLMSKKNANKSNKIKLCFVWNQNATDQWKEKDSAVEKWCWRSGKKGNTNTGDEVCGEKKNKTNMRYMPGWKASCMSEPSGGIKCSLRRENGGKLQLSELTWLCTTDGRELEAWWAMEPAGGPCKLCCWEVALCCTLTPSLHSGETKLLFHTSTCKKRYSTEPSRANAVLIYSSLTSRHF